MKHHIITVGDLREALKDLPDDRFIACQVVGQDHTAWNCIGEFISQVPNGTIAAIQLSHAELKTLPDPMQVESIKIN